MHSLRDIQIEVSRAVRSESAGTAAALLRDDGIEPAVRLQIYRNNHRLAARATLQAAYPVIERLGGADWFSSSAARYIAEHPSTSGDLQNLGEHYPNFLRSEFAGTPYAYFADIATLEWAYQWVLTAAELPPVDLAKLRSFAPDAYDRLVFVPRPALRIVESHYPVLTIWRANQPQAGAAQARIGLDGGPAHVLLIRRSDHVELRDLSAGSCCLLREFLRGRPLGVAADAAAAAVGDFDLDASLADIARLETIADIQLPRPNDDPQPNRRVQ